MVKIITLGCGGGRHQTVDQSFKTGGFRVHDERFKVHVDPGPGALLLTNKYGLDPEDLDALFISHAHPDHYTDGELLISAMTKNGEGRRGALLGSESVIRGIDFDRDCEGNVDRIGPSISQFHRKKVKDLEFLSHGESFDINSFRMEATKTFHSDPSCIGFKLETSAGKIGYTADTEKFEELPKIFEDVRVLIGNVTRPNGKRIDHHLCSDDFAEILEEVDPDLGIILHMGMLFLRNSPNKESSKIEDSSGVRTIPGYSGTEISLSDGVKIKNLSESKSFHRFY